MAKDWRVFPNCSSLVRMKNRQDPQETGPGEGILPGQRLRGRGATSNRAGRYESQGAVAADDGWDLPEEQRLVRTEVRLEKPRSALSYNSSPDLPFDRSINGPLVTMPTGWRCSASTESTSRVTACSASQGWYGSVLVPIATVATR